MHTHSVYIELHGSREEGRQGGREEARKDAGIEGGREGGWGGWNFKGGILRRELASIQYYSQTIPQRGLCP